MTQDLYGLMPAIHRRRDAEGAGALRAVFDVLQQQHDLVHRDIGALYDDAFIETCEPWLIPYIAELVAAGRLGRRLHPGVDTRALVADTLAERQRKGVAAALERVVSRATGWAAQVVEPGERALRTAAVGQGDATRPSAGARLPTLRDRRALAAACGPQDDRPRSPRTQAGARDAGSVEIRLWRLQSAPLRGVDAAVAGGDGARRRLHPLDLDMPLFAPPEDGDEAALLGPVTRRGLALALRDPGARPPFALRLGGHVLDRREIGVADLAAWTAPLGAQPRALVDPERGRVLLTHRADHGRPLRSDHSHGSVDDLGGGSYPRPPSPSDADRRRFGGWTAGAVASSEAVELTPALALWAAAADDGVITLATSATLLPAGAPEPPEAAQGARGAPARSGTWSVPVAGRRLAVIAAEGERPCLRGGVEVHAGDGGVLILDGLMIGGVIRLHGAAILVLRHCTVWPTAGHPAVEIVAQGAGGRVVVERSMLAAIVSHAEEVRLEATDSIVGGVQGRGTGLRLRACTVTGSVAAGELDAADTLFLADLDVSDRTAGSVEHCWLPRDARTPRARACLARDPGAPGSGVVACAPPRFASRRPGQPGYMHPRVDPGGPFETGASDGQAIGVFHGVGEALRRDNLADALAEHLPLHVRAVVTHAC